MNRSPTCTNVHKTSEPMKKGLLLINLGTPNNPDTRSVKRYLAEFLSDKRVITLPSFLRYILLYGAIIPFRSKQSAHAYQQIWTPKGSPLLVNSQLLLEKVQARLGENYQVALGMRYGAPSIQMALEELQNCQDITVLPLYPQYSSSATGSSIEVVLNYFSKKNVIPTLYVIRDFHQHPSFIHALATVIRPYRTDHDYFLFSYHGLPVQHIVQGGCLKQCQAQCPPITENDSGCYRAQCFQTTRSLALALHLNNKHYGTSFQSRLGKTPWIQPYTDDVLNSLAEQGIKRLAVVCPSFVADCLETLEEIAIRAKAQWCNLGGKELTLIPCLNAHDNWVEAITQII